MNRTRFLGYSALLAGSTKLGCAPPGGTPSETPRAASDEPFELHEATVADLQQGMESGRWTARSITEELLAIAYAYEQATKHRKPREFLPMLA
jgi:hypothetical protein